MYSIRYSTMPASTFSSDSSNTFFPCSVIPDATHSVPDPRYPPAVARDRMKQRRSRFVPTCSLLLELLFVSSRTRASSTRTTGLRHCHTSEPAGQGEGKLQVAEEGDKVLLDEGREEGQLEDLEGERREKRGGGGGRGVVTAATLQRSVKHLHFGGWEEKEAAAAEIKRMAQKDGHARKSLAALGVIPSLVSMLDSDDDRRRRLAVQALVELAKGSSSNKALMVEAGVFKRLQGLIDTRDTSRTEECLALLLSISSLAKTRCPVAPSDVLPRLIEILDDGYVVNKLKLVCLGTLYNLSTNMGNTRAIISAGAVRTLARLSKEKAASEIALATLGNLVVTATGKTALERDDAVLLESLVEIMTWRDKPRSRELVVYVLMVLAQRSTLQRQKMVELGLVPLLLEVALLGTPLARKRALETLQWFKSARQAKTTLAVDTVANQEETKEHREDFKKMVQQSLHMNMESLIRRANIPKDASTAF